jgi:hypothetical protein
MRYLLVIGIACILLMTVPPLYGGEIIKHRMEPDVIKDMGVCSQVATDTPWGTGEQRTELEFSFTWNVEEVSRNGVTYERIVLENGGVEPGLNGEERPFYQHTIQVLGSIQDLDVDFQDPVKEDADLVPSLVPQRIGSEAEVLDPRWIGDDLESPADWTLHRTSATTIDGQEGEMYSLRLYPVEYDGDGGCKVYSTARVAYSVNTVLPMGTRIDPGHKPTGEIKYLIITDASLVDAVMPLALWKSQKGLFCEVTTLDEINAMYSGTDKALKMRNYVMDMEDTYDLEYLLIVGDWDKVPTRLTRNSYYLAPMGEPDTFASDLYFACVDNGTTWNNDVDNLYAEEGELDDAVPDLANGRLAINNATQLSQVVSDLLQREKNLNWDIYNDVAVYIAGDPGGLPGDTTMVMDDLWTKYGSGEFAGRETIYHDNSSTLEFNSSNFKKVIDDRYQAVCYYAHGECDSIPGLFNNSQMGNLSENGSDGSFFAMACNTGWFDNPNQGTDMGAVENCFGEMLTETPKKGLVGYMGSSRIAVGEIDTTYSADAPGLQEDYCRAVEKSHQGNLEPTVGKVWQETVTHFSNSFYPFQAQMFDNPGLRTFLQYNLLGEPDAPLIFRPPDQLHLNFTLAPDGSWVWANVTNDAGDNVQGADVCIFRYGELGRSAISNATGEVNITIPANNGGIINITASRPGDRPATDTFELPDNLAPEPLYTIIPKNPDGNAGYYISQPVITLTGDEPVEVEWKWDAGSVQTNMTQAVVVAPEGNHTLHFRVKDVVGFYSSWVDLNVSVDLTPPGLTTTTDPATPDGDNDWFVTLPKVNLTADEPLDQAVYWIDSGFPRDYNGSVPIPEGEHIIYFKAFDIAGNFNTINTSVKVDLSYPVTTLNISHQPDGLNDFYVTIPNVEILCTYDPTVSIEYKWDEAGWNLYSAPVSPPEGSHKLFYRGIDLAGNVEVERNWTFKVDTVPPVLNVTVDPAQPDGLDGYYVTSPTVIILTNEGDRKYALLNPGVDFDWTNKSQVVNFSTSWSGPISVGDGEWRLYTMALDMAGNLGYLSPLDFKVDTTKPSFSWNIDPQQPDGEDDWYVTSPIISIGSVSPDTSVYWTLNDDDNWSEVEGAIVLENRENLVKFKAEDGAGNVIFDDTGTIKVDLDEPGIIIQLPLETEIYGSMVNVQWNGIDTTSGMKRYEISVDDKNWQKMGNKTQTVLYSLTTGIHRVSIRGYDKAGNEGINVRTFNVDANAPTVESKSPTGINASINTVIEVTFSKEMKKDTVAIVVEDVNGSISWDGENVIFTPDQPLDYITIYNVTVTGLDIYGNSLGTYEWSFTTQVEPEEEDKPSDSSDELTLYIVLGIIVALIIIVLVVVLVIRSRKKESLDEEDEGEEDEEEDDEDYDDDEYEDDEYDEDDEEYDDDDEEYEDDDDEDYYDDDEYEDEDEDYEDEEE